MSSKTLINGTGYTINKGKTLINGTGYTINKGKTLINGTGYTINFTPLWYTEWFYRGDYFPSSGSYEFVKTSSSLKAIIYGRPTQTGDPRTECGFDIPVNTGDNISITVNANGGTNWSDNIIRIHYSNGTVNNIATTTGWWTNKTIIMTVQMPGVIRVIATTGHTGADPTRYIEITSMVINNQ